MTSLKLIITKLKHFYLNKYIISLFSRKKYHISYDYQHKALWFRTYKVASRTVNQTLKQTSKEDKYIYGSQIAYLSFLHDKYFKFSFVRNPESRLISAWSNKVIEQNYFDFDEVEHEKMKDLNHFISWVESLDIDNCDEHLKSQCSSIDLNNIDFLGRFENFSNDFRFVLNRLGIDNSEIKHLNKSRRTEISLSKSQQLRIYYIYEKDFQIFYPDHFKRIV